MSAETRSLWEQLDSDAEPWRRGRIYLISIGLFHFLVQATMIFIFAWTGQFERAGGLAVAATFYWLQFYFVWIGVHWARFLWGAWNLVVGFCFIIWAWRDLSGFETLIGVITFVIGFVLCFSPAIYFFALHQRETRRLRESIMVAAVCLVIVFAIGASLFGYGMIHSEMTRDAMTFASEANHRIYHDHDEQWVSGHVTPESYQHNGPERLHEFFAMTEESLGEVGQVSTPAVNMSLRLKWPPQVVSTARVAARAPSKIGIVILHETLVSSGQGWQLDHMWWDPAPYAEQNYSR
jgi:hypothetical protein